MFSLINILNSTGNIPLGGWWVLLAILGFIPPYTLVPRFILNLRELYARDLQGRRGSEMDTAFGLSSESGHCVTRSTIMFVDGEQDLGLQHGDDIQMEERGICDTGGSRV